MDILLHVALGWKYRGRQVQQAAVVYAALEGRNGIPARLEAFKVRHVINEAPFYLMTSPVDLVTGFGNQSPINRRKQKKWLLSRPNM
jgi:hypothetical protein